MPSQVTLARRELRSLALDRMWTLVIEQLQIQAASKGVMKLIHLIMDLHVVILLLPLVASR